MIISSNFSISRHLSILTPHRDKCTQALSSSGSPMFFLLSLPMWAILWGRRRNIETLSITGFPSDISGMSCELYFCSLRHLKETRCAYLQIQVFILFRLTIWQIFFFFFYHSQFCFTNLISILVMNIYEIRPSQEHFRRHWLSYVTTRPRIIEPNMTDLICNATLALPSHPSSVPWYHHVNIIMSSLS